MIRFVLIATLALGGCTTMQWQQDEAAILRVVQKIKAGVRVVVAETQQISDFVCGQLPSVQSGLNVAIQAAGPNPGSRTTQAILAAQASIRTVGNYCAGPRTTGAQILLAAWNALKTAQAAVAVAQVKS